MKGLPDMYQESRCGGRKDFLHQRLNPCYVLSLGNALDWPVQDPCYRGKTMAAAKKRKGGAKKKAAKRSAKKAKK